MHTHMHTLQDFCPEASKANSALLVKETQQEVVESACPPFYCRALEAAEQAVTKETLKTGLNYLLGLENGDAIVTAAGSQSMPCEWEPAGAFQWSLIKKEALGYLQAAGEETARMK
ncbi:hypothetical protein DV515_00010340, partial [Chloebia gouldiae]